MCTNKVSLESLGHEKVKIAFLRLIMDAFNQSWKVTRLYPLISVTEYYTTKILYTYIVRTDENPLGNHLLSYINWKDKYKYRRILSYLMIAPPPIVIEIIKQNLVTLYEKRTQKTNQKSCPRLFTMYIYNTKNPKYSVINVYRNQTKI